MVKGRLTVLLVFVLTSLNIDAQTFSRLLSLQSNNELDVLFREADSLKSYLDFEKANEIYTNIEKAHRSELIKCYSKLSRIDNYLRGKKVINAKSIITELEDGQTCVSEEHQADLNFLKAQYLYQTGYYDSALVMYELTKEMFDDLSPDSLLKGELLMNYGELYLYAFEEVRKSKRLIDQAGVYWQNQKDVNHFNLGRIYYDMAAIYGRRTEPVLQLKYSEKAFSISELYIDRYPRLNFACYTALAEGNALNDDFDKAINWLERQLVFAEKFNLNENWLLYSYNSLAEYHLWNDNYEESIKYNDILFSQWNQKIPSNKFLYSLTLKRNAQCYQELENYEKAKEYYELALSVNEKKDRRKAQLLRHYGDFLAITNKYDQALSYYNSSIEIYKNSWELNQKESYLFGLILGWKQKGSLISSKIGQDSQALNAFLKAAYYLDCHKDIFYFDETQLNFSYIFKSLYENIIGTAESLYSLNGDQNLLEKIFYSIESNKYQTLWKKIKDKEAFTSVEVPEKLASEIELLQNKIKRQSIKYHESNDENIDDFIELNNLKAKLFKLTNDELTYKLTANAISLMDLQSIIYKDELVLQLFEGDSMCHGLLVSKLDCSYFNFPLSSNYKKQLDYYQHIIRGDELNLPVSVQFDNYFDCISEISVPFNEILEDALKAKSFRNLTIIPDGIFNFLPLESFIRIDTINQNVSNFEDLPFYINELDISYHISGKTLFQSRMESSLKNKGVITAIGPHEDAILFSAIKEVHQIQEKFDRKSHVILDNQRNGFFKDHQDSKILHIASHAVIDTNNYHKSFLHFGAEEDETLKVYDFEIGSHKFNDLLVVLNACETFKGQMYEGEGVYSLSQSFMIAGAGAVVSTLWQIEDRSAASFMNKFYEKIKKGYSYKASINATKRSMIAQNATAHPFYWSGYLYNGATNAFSHDRKILKQWRGLICLGSLFFFLLFYKAILRKILEKH